MLVYIYSADLFCQRCGEDIRARLTREGRAPANPEDETSFDSDEFPKGPYPPSESDCPDHCGAGEDCLDAIELGEGEHKRKIGAWLENELTQEGLDYTRQAIENGGEVANLWAGWYPEALPTQPEDDGPGFVLTIETGNNAFENGSAPFEVARILREVAGRLEKGERDIRLADTNGNHVGRALLKD